LARRRHQHGDLQRHPSKSHQLERHEHRGSGANWRHHWQRCCDVGGVASNGVTFTVTVPPPSITSLNPTSGLVGASVTITGTNFAASQGSSTVKFNGTTAPPTSWSAASITALFRRCHDRQRRSDRRWSVEQLREFYSPRPAEHHESDPEFRHRRDVGNDRRSELRNLPGN